MNYFSPNSTNQWSPNQLQVSRSYFLPPSPTGAGGNPASAFQAASAGGYGAAALNPWMSGATNAPTAMPWGSQSLFGQGALPSSVMQGGTYAWGQQGGYALQGNGQGQFDTRATIFAPPQLGGYVPINTIPG